MVLSGPSGVRIQQRDVAGGAEHSVAGLGIGGRPAHIESPKEESNAWPHPGNFYMLPPVWGFQDQQVAAPGRVREKGKPPLGMKSFGG